MGKDLKGRELGVGLTQRKDGKYSAKYTTKSGKRVEKYFDKLKGDGGAMQWLYMSKASEVELNSSTMTVDGWFDYWIKNFKEDITSDNTTKNYKNRYIYNCKEEIGDMKLCDVRQMDCQKVINKMCDKGYAKSTVEQCIIAMHAIFKGAVTNKFIKENPVVDLVIKKSAAKSKDRRFMTIEEQNEFCKYAAPTMYGNAYRLALETGMRCGEIGGLKFSDIDFDNKTVRIGRTLLQEKTRGGFYFGSPKTENSVREIPLTDAAVEILEAQKQLKLRLKFCSHNWTDDERWQDLVFVTVNGNPVGGSTFSHMLKRIVNNINTSRKLDGNMDLFENVHMHSLRHTFATRCIEAGMKPHVLQRILGHSTVETTMSLYVHVTDTEKFKEIKKFEQYREVV